MHKRTYQITSLSNIRANYLVNVSQPSDVRRTVAINCGYIGTSDYTIEPDDREFMIRVHYV